MNAVSNTSTENTTIDDGDNTFKPGVAASTSASSFSIGLIGSFVASTCKH